MTVRVKCGEPGMYNRGCRCDPCREANSSRIRATRVQRMRRRVEVDGRLVAPDAPAHGRASTYENWGCRCRECSAVATRDGVKIQRRRRLHAERVRRDDGTWYAPGAPRHGTPNVYDRYGCRCAECRAAKSRYAARWRRRRRNVKIAEVRSVATSSERKM